MKSNKTELRGLSLVLLKEETPKLFHLLTPFFLLTSPILFSYFTFYCIGVGFWRKGYLAV